MKLVDQEARDRIRTALDQSLIVEAAAGTGKTTELVHRLVAVLKSGRTQVDRVVAVTFTRKAAGELRLRLRTALDSERAAAGTTQEAENLREAVSRLEEARIGTIHAFCGDLLRERPIEAGIDPGFQEAAEDEAERLFGSAFDSWIQNRMDDLPPGLRRALSRSMVRETRNGSPLDQLGNAARKVLEWRDYRKPWRRAEFDREGMLQESVAMLSRLADLSDCAAKKNDPLRTGLRPVRELVRWVKRAEAEDRRDLDRLEAMILDLLRPLKRADKKGSGRYSDTLSRDQVWQMRNQLIEFLEAFREEADADLAALLWEEFQSFVQSYENDKQQAGRLDFVDLLIRARDLLKESREVRNYFQQKFTHIFVDEFQDTDPLQTEILMLLACSDPEQANWRKSVPAPGKLFLVGDPKQSIYRFRRADVRLYQEVKETIKKGGVGVVYLTQSFRSVASIQEFVNTAFSKEIQEDEDSGQPEYVPLHNFRQDLPKQPVVVALPVPEPYGLRDLAMYRIEESLPEATAAYIDWLLTDSDWEVSDRENGTGPIAPRHICLLFRRFVSWTSDITRPYTRALEARGIPHLLIGSRSFHQREEVETLRVALTAVEWPDDELSVYSTLRGGLFSIPDGLLFQFRETHGTLHPFFPAPESPDEASQPLRQALDVLARLHRRRNSRPFVDTINELLEATRAHAGLALRPAGQQVLANVQRICDLARRFELSGGASFRSFVEYLAGESENAMSAESPIFEEGVDGVRLMTVHAAKGLEFPIVMLADLTCRLAGRRPDKYVDTDSGLAAFSVLGCAPKDLLDHRKEETERDRAEGVRLAYVAATRARDLLVVPAVGDRPWDGWLSPLNTALYPDRSRRREKEPAPGCPAFGETTVLKRPTRFDGTAESSVRPGLHRASSGEHPVVWWDPALLDLDVQPNFGLRQRQVLSGADAADTAARLNTYQRWRQQRQETIEAGSRVFCSVSTVTSRSAKEGPAEPGPVNIEPLRDAERRVGGSRFGSLVHAVLKDVAPEASQDMIEQWARFHGRVLAAPAPEMEAAVRSVQKVLQHELFRAVTAAKRFHRELPVVIVAEDELLEGVVDVAILQDDHWSVIDFKTDSGATDRYVRQVQWYLKGLEQATKLPGTGWILEV